MKRYTRYYDIYEERPYKGYMRGNMENKISITILWILGKRCKSGGGIIATH